MLPQGIPTLVQESVSAQGDEGLRAISVESQSWG